MPPLARRMPGRPTTKRKRHASEQEGRFSSTRVFVPRTVRCGKCLEYGHNQKSCKNEKKPVVPLLPKKRGRPRKHPLLTEYDESLRASQSSQPPMQKNKSKKEASSSKVLKASRSKKRLLHLIKKMFLQLKKKLLMVFRLGKVMEFRMRIMVIVLSLGIMVMIFRLGKVVVLRLGVMVMIFRLGMLMMLLLKIVILLKK